MCGIVGFSSRKNYSFNKIQTLALCNSYDRGGDASGFYTPSTGFIKDITTAHNFITKGLMAKLKPDNILIGHLRKSSVGGNTIPNAHPFENNGVILCHNGTLRNYIQLATSYDIPHHEYSTDSQVLAKAVSKEMIDYNNTEESLDILEVLYKYEGSAALLWYDTNTKIMYAYRDDSRPLYYGIISGSMYISSLEYALEIIGCKNIKQFSSDTLYSIKDGKIIKTVSKKQSDFYKLGKDSDFKHWSMTGWKSDTNLKYSGILNDIGSTRYLIGFRLQYIQMTVRPKQYLGGKNSSDYAASLTKDSRYEVLDADGSYLWISDDNNELKKVLYTSFDIKNVFPICGRYCTVYNSIANRNDDIVASRGDVLKVLTYNFKSDKFRACVLKSGEVYTIPIVSFLPYSEKEYIEVIEKLGESKEELIKNKVEIIQEDDLPWDTEENEESEADGANWVHFDSVETYIDIISGKIEDIMDKYARSQDIKHNLDDLHSTVVDTYNKTKFESLINEEK